jgi:nudix-type nucleoside diphosphatase (YffH/AdpP family)
MADIVTVETKYDGWSRFRVASIRLADGSIVKREIEDHGNAVCVLPYDPVRRMGIVIGQFRAPVFHAAGESLLIEAIAGLAEGDDAAACARREAMEEAGLQLGAIEQVTAAWTMPGISTERMTLFLGAYSAADRIGPGGGLKEEHEDIEVIELSLNELARMADEGKLTDLKTLFLLQTLRLRQPALFG